MTRLVLAAFLVPFAAACGDSGVDCPDLGVDYVVEQSYGEPTWCVYADGRELAPD